MVALELLAVLAFRAGEFGIRRPTPTQPQLAQPVVELLRFAVVWRPAVCAHSRATREESVKKKRSVEERAREW